MKKQIYMSGFLVLLLLIAVTFYFQIKTMSQGNPYQYYLLGVIVAVGGVSYYLSKRMKTEHWFINQGKK